MTNDDTQGGAMRSWHVKKLEAQTRWTMLQIRSLDYEMAHNSAGSTLQDVLDYHDTSPTLEAEQCLNGY